MAVWLQRMRLHNATQDTGFSACIAGSNMSCQNSSREYLEAASVQFMVDMNGRNGTLLLVDLGAGTLTKVCCFAAGRATMVDQWLDFLDAHFAAWCELGWRYGLRWVCWSL